MSQPGPWERLWGQSRAGTEALVRPEQLGDSERPQGCWKSNLWLRLLQQVTTSPVPSPAPELGSELGREREAENQRGGRQEAPSPQRGAQTHFIIP